MNEDDVTRFLDGKQEVFRRAIAEIEQRVGFFVADWGSTCGFSVERIESARVKDPRRVFAKARRKGLSEADDLLQRCDEKDGRRRFSVPDLIGVRVLVRSLNDVAAVKRALEDLRAGGRELYPLGNPEDFDLEDMNGDPRPSGYRALHIDGSVTVRLADRDFTVPFELQVKTLAQHVFGQHTHEEAYVPDGANGDPRYEWCASFRARSPSSCTPPIYCSPGWRTWPLRDDIARVAGRGLDGQAASIGSVWRAPGVTSPVS